MLSRQIAWHAALGALLLCAACAAPTAAPGRPTAASAQAATTTFASTATATASSTPPPLNTRTPTPTATPNATLAATPTFTPTDAFTSTLPLAPVIGPANAARVAAAAAFGPNARLDQLAWAADSQRLAVAGAPGVLIYDAATETVTRPITTSAWATSASFSPDGLALAAGSVDATVVVFDLATGDPLVALVGPGVRVEQVRYASAAVVASLGADNAVHLWDVVGQAYLGSLEAAPGPAHSLDTSPSAPPGQQWLMASGDRAVRVWALPSLLTATVPISVTPALTLTQLAPEGGAALSADGRWLASSNASGTIQVWDLTTGQAVKRLARVGSAPLRLAFSPDGQILASAYQDGLLRLWSLPGTTGAVATLTGHSDRVTGLAFSPDGRSLASTGWDGTVRIWQAPASAQP